MDNKRLKNIITIIICASICIGIIVIKVLDKDDKAKEQQSEKQTVQVTTDQEQAEASTSEDVISESNMSDDVLYDENASDNYVEQGETDITVYLKNGEVLYNQDNIPIDFFEKLMERIQKFCDLNYPDVVKEIEIYPESVVVDDKEVIFKANLMNGHYITVSYEIEKKQFTMSDTIQ